MVIAPLKEKYPPQVRALDFKKVDEILIETITGWEKIPNLMECILTPFFWLLGISFLGLDPKTVIVFSRNKDVYHRWEELGSIWFGKIYLRIKWLFYDTIPWTFSAKFSLLCVTKSSRIQLSYKARSQKVGFQRHFSWFID